MPAGSALRSDNDKIVVHHIAPIDAVAFGDELILARPIMDQKRVRVAALADGKRLSGTNCNYVNFDARRSLEDRQDVSKQTRNSAGRCGRAEGDKPLVGVRNVDCKNYE